MKKRNLTGMLTAAMVFTGCTASGSTSVTEDIYHAGSYTASEFGMLDNVTVTMEFDGTSITNVVIEGQETEGIGSKAISEMPDQILDAQSAEVDGVSGATVTSTAIRKAAENCIAQAKGDSGENAGTAEGMSADVIVIGGGAAGLSAAATAAKDGASVIVLEANGRIGGSTSLSGGHMTMIDEEFNSKLERNDEDLKKYLDYEEDQFPGQWGEDLKKLQEQITAYLESDQVGKFDSIERCMVDHYLAGTGKDTEGNDATLDYELIRKGVDANMDITNWLVKEGNMIVAETPYNQHGNTPEGTGSGLIDALNTIVGKYDNVQVLLNTEAQSLIMENGNVTGVNARNEMGEEQTFTAEHGVVIATGSFSSNGEMAAQYQTIGTGLTADNDSTNPATNTGKGIEMAQQAGAQLRDMGFMCILVNGYNGKAPLSSWTKINNASSLLLNKNGVRFCNEAKAGLMEGAKNSNIINQPEGLVYAVGDQKMIDALNEVSETFVDDMVNAGVLYIGDTLEEVAEKAGLDAETAAESVQAFNKAVDSGTDDVFGRDTFNGKVEEGQYVIAIGEACYHLTFGGLVIDTDGHVMNEDNQPIESLFAAGDVISGVEGVTHISCECLTTAIYYGQVSGVNAYLDK